MKRRKQLRISATAARAHGSQVGTARDTGRIGSGCQLPNGHGNHHMASRPDPLPRRLRLTGSQ